MSKLRKLAWALLKDSIDRDMETLSAEYAESINQFRRTVERGRSHD